MTETDKAKDFYENESVGMERYKNRNYWAYRYHNTRMGILKKIMEKNFSACQSFLDVGCGTGEYLNSTRNLNYNVGIDISKGYLFRCKLTIKGHLVLADSKALPFRDRTFDCILCSEVIEHIEEQSAAINELLRISDGYLLISTPNHGILRQIMFRVRKQELALVDARVGHVSILRFSELIKKFRVNSKLINAYTVHIFPPYLDEIHIPAFFAPIVVFAERLLNRIMPSLGTMTVVFLQRRK